MAGRRWQDGANLMLGLWLFVSPWFLSPWMLGYEATTAARNAYALGAGLMLFAVLAAYLWVVFAADSLHGWLRPGATKGEAVDLEEVPG